MHTGPFSSASSSEFELRVRQAILSAKHSIPQIAVVLFAFDAGAQEPHLSETALTAIQNSMSMRLRGGLRDSDTVAALANGRVGVLLHSVQGPQDLDLVMNRLLKRVSEPVQFENQTFFVEPRIGAALFPENGDSVSSLIEYAENDLALAQASRKAYTLYASRPGGIVSARQWMTELRRAIISDQLFLTFQPKVSLSEGRITGVEVLLRWQHPEHGVIVPDQFIPVAERTGLIIPLTLWVLQQSLLQCRKWTEMGVGLSVAVNLTMWNLEARELPGQIAALLRDTRVEPQNLELEITETSIMSDPQRVIRTLNEIRNLGVQFAIDDFGTGYSSFAYLTKLPVSCIKIDKSFVLNIDCDRDSSVIVKSIIDLGHNLGLKVVAEGVETARSRKMLKSFQCDEGQGYYFCRPVPADAMTQLLLEPPAAMSSPLSEVKILEPARPSAVSGFDPYGMR